MGVGVAQGAAIECGRCRKNVPPGARYCRRCGYALQGGPLTRALRSVGAKRGRAPARPPRNPLFGVEPVLWLFAVLGGIATSVVRNVGRLASPEAVGHAIGSGLVMLVVGAVVARVGWAVGRRSQAVGILSGMAAIFFLAMGLIARWAGTEAQPPRRSPADAAAVAAPVALSEVAPEELPRTPGRSLPSTALSQLPLRWRSSGRQLDCTIKNETSWRVAEVEIQLTVWSKGRVVRTEWCKVPASIAPGATATLDLPLTVDQDPQRTFDCRVTAARGVANAGL